MANVIPDSAERFSKFAEFYDRVRPHPPEELANLLRQWSGTTDPDVVDIGCGTGLSSTIWPEATGVEPSAEMRAIAAQRGIRVVDGTGEETGLPDGCADIVTVSHALHWFDAARAFPEIARIMRPGAVLAAFDFDWPPAVDPEVDAAYRDFETVHHTLEAERGLRPNFAPKSEHLQRLRDSGLFRHVNEVCLHMKETGGAARFVDFAASQGGVIALLEEGVSEDTLGLTRLREVTERRMTDHTTWWWTCRVRLATR
ncbi:class I SAM-dependent methyltransferase [Streptomyces noursei]|uniref:class I SAM-dependent methyltransferase n=1 Tax=Streptomyces noursei TaxID=1971 RepID=UPI0023B77EC8|nr:class I SAM-dependent methyltransferase [Streptomyces noursei]